MTVTEGSITYTPSGTPGDMRFDPLTETWYIRSLSSGWKGTSVSGGGVPNPLPDDEVFYIGTDLAGGLVNDVANGNGRVIFVGDRTFTDALSFAGVQPGVASIFTQNDNDVYDAYVTVLADDSSATVNIKAEKTTNPQHHSLLTLLDTGIIDAYTVGTAPSFNVHDNLAVLNPFSTPAAPTASQSATAGTIPAGDYGYVIWWETAAGTTDPSDETVVTLDGTHKGAVTVPTLPAGVTGASVGRTKKDDDGGGPHYVVTTGLSAGVYQDNTADNTLTVLVPTANTAGGNLSVAGELRMQDGQLLALSTDRLYGWKYDADGAGDIVLVSATGNIYDPSGWGFIELTDPEVAIGSGATRLRFTRADNIADLDGFLHLFASTTAYASMNIPDGTAPTSPATGDLYAVSGVLTTPNGLSLGKAFAPADDGGTIQTACHLYAGTGAPSDANGINGDYYLRADGTLLSSTIYHKVADVWVGLSVA